MKNNIFNVTTLSDKIYYTPCLGLSDVIMPTYNEYIHTYAQIFFHIMKKFKISYYVFAGSSIGYLRAKKNLPWVDDYDIIIFENDINLFENEIIIELEKNGFICAKNNISGYQIHSEKMSYNSNPASYDSLFICDVFFSIVDKNGFVKNIGGKWGRYNDFNISYDMVYPPKYLVFEEIELPFFNKYEEDVICEYGDIYDQVDIYTNKNVIIFKENYKKVYDEYYIFLEYAKQKTIEYMSKNKIEHEYINDVTFDNNIKLTNVLDVLLFINDNKIKKITMTENIYLQYCISIKYFFKNITIEYHCCDILPKKYFVFLNYISNIKIFSAKLNTFFNDIVFIKKPEIMYYQ